MKIIEPSYCIETPIEPEQLYKDIELVARTCYKSEHKIAEGSAIELVKKLVSRKHFPMFDHFFIRVRFIVDRGVSHELVRHRLCAFAQESTRYCNYSREQFERSVTFIHPPFLKPETYARWLKAMEAAEKAYFDLLDAGHSPQEARSVLPNSLKTEIVVTANITEWRHILKLRTSAAAHPQMRQVMCPLLVELSQKLPLLFRDILETEVRS